MITMSREIMEKLINIQIDNVTLPGQLVIPKSAEGVVLFAHGSGSSRLSPRNTFVADELQKEGIATLLIDLLTEREDEVYETRFDIELLTARLVDITHWLQNQPETKNLAIGLFGASTGAASALNVAARLGSEITAVVSRGGRPDLAMDVLAKVVSPTLLIVGGSDFVVIELNKQAFQRLTCQKEIKIIKGATHLFEEPGTLEEVARLASEWFKKYFIEEGKK